MWEPVKPEHVILYNRITSLYRCSQRNEQPLLIILWWWGGGGGGGLEDFWPWETTLTALTVSTVALLMIISPVASPTKLNEHDHFHIIFDQLRPHSARWRDIGIGLRFLPSQLDTIQASPFHLPNAPSSYMCAMLAQWLQSAPGDTRGNTGHATLESLKEAVDKAGLGADAQRLHI